ncbi:ABC transporter permease subunit [Dietzia sp.]|uniref:ABC transporter permease subunit n=1 Tax=Dietzia sp. TaxID=1871616 RepID=UPI002FDB4A22
MNLLKAEWIKATSLRSSWILLGISLVLALGMAALMAKFSGQEIEDAGGQSSQINFTAGGLVSASYGSLAVLFVWVLALVLVTGEYRTGTIKSVFLMAPRRWDVYAVKTGFFAVLGAVVSFVFSLLCLLIAYAISGSGDLSPWTGGGLAAAGKYAVFVFISMFLMVGISAIIRNMAGTIVLVIAWIFIVESLVGTIPKIGEPIAKWMPFVNGMSWISGSDPAQGAVSTNALSSPGNILWFAVVCVVIWAAGLFVLRSRDA